MHSKLRKTRTSKDWKKSSDAKIRFIRWSHIEIRLCIGKSVFRTTFDSCDKSRYSEPSYVEFTVFICETVQIQFMTASNGIISLRYDMAWLSAGCISFTHRRFLIITTIPDFQPRNKQPMFSLHQPSVRPVSVAENY